MCSMTCPVEGFYLRFYFESKKWGKLRAEYRCEKRPCQGHLAREIGRRVGPRRGLQGPIGDRRIRNSRLRIHVLQYAKSRGRHGLNGRRDGCPRASGV